MDRVARPRELGRPGAGLTQKSVRQQRLLPHSASTARTRHRPSAARKGPAKQQPGGPASLARRLLSRTWRAPAADQLQLDASPSTTAALADEHAAAVQQEKEQPGPAATDQQAAAQAPAAEAAEPGAEAQQGQQRSRVGSLLGATYTWLMPWGGARAASSSSAAGSSSAGGGAGAGAATASVDTLELCDGMAASAELASLSAPPATRQSGWYHSGWYLLGARGAGGAAASSQGSMASMDAASEEVLVDHATLQLIRQRVLQRSRPGQRSDPFKLGLVVEGGGMRGCVSGGALQAMGDLGLQDVFDAVYGSSAGAINATYFLSRQRDGVEIYHDRIANEQFISLRRLWKGDGDTPVLNLPFLIDHVMNTEHPLNWQAVLDSPIPLKVVASSLDVLQPVILEGFKGADDLAMCLKASAHVPEIAGSEPLVHRGQRLVDAAVFEPIPFRSAIADGCTHVLVLGTRPRRVNKGRINTALEDAMEAAIKRAVLSPEYMRPAWQAEVEYLAADGISQDDMLARALEEGAEKSTWFAGAFVYPIFPGPASSFSPLCTDVPTLKAGVAEGRRVALAVLEATLGDVLDFSRFHGEVVSNITPITRRGAGVSSERRWRALVSDDSVSHH